MVLRVPGDFGDAFTRRRHPGPKPAQIGRRGVWEPEGRIVLCSAAVGRRDAHFTDVVLGRPVTRPESTTPRREPRWLQKDAGDARVLRSPNGESVVIGRIDHNDLRRRAARSRRTPPSSRSTRAPPPSAANVPRARGSARILHRQAHHRHALRVRVPLHAVATTGRSQDHRSSGRRRRGVGTRTPSARATRPTCWSSPVSTPLTVSVGPPS